MKKHFTLLIIFSPSGFFAQQLTPTVVATSGDFYLGTAATLSWTLGEVVTDTYIGTGNQLTQGFQQPDIRFSGIDDLAPEISMNAYPNPTAAEVNFEIKDNAETLAIAILDVDGKIIFTDTYSGTSVKKIDLSGYADGMYLLNITSPEKGLIKTIKIQKL